MRWTQETDDRAVPFYWARLNDNYDITVACCDFTREWTATIRIIGGVGFAARIKMHTKKEAQTVGVEVFRLLMKRGVL